MDKRLLYIEELAKILSLSRSKAYQLVMRGDIPSVKIGRSRRIPIDAINEYLNDLRSEAVCL